MLKRCLKFLHKKKHDKNIKMKTCHVKTCEAFLALTFKPGFYFQGNKLWNFDCLFLIVVNVNSRIKNKKKCGSKKEIVDYLLFVLYV